MSITVGTDENDVTQEIPLAGSSALAQLRDAIETATPEETTADYLIPLNTNPRLVARFRMLTIDEQEQIGRARSRMRQGMVHAAALDILTNCNVDILIDNGNELISTGEQITFTSPELATMLGVSPRPEEVIPLLYPGGTAVGQVESLLEWSGFTATSAIEVNRGNSRKIPSYRTPHAPR